jgi:hypothetical protein
MGDREFEINVPVFTSIDLLKRRCGRIDNK